MSEPDAIGNLAVKGALVAGQRLRKFDVAGQHKIFRRGIRLHSGKDAVLAMTEDRAEQDQRLLWAFDTERRRLLAFIRRRIPDEIDAEDLLQDVFCELVETYRMMKPVAHAGAWLMQVAKNRITDLFAAAQGKWLKNGGRRMLEDLLPSPEAGPDALFARGVLLAEIEAALGELPGS